MAETQPRKRGGWLQTLLLVVLLLVVVVVFLRFVAPAVFTGIVEAALEAGWGIVELFGAKETGGE